jgi:hypothetical protein
MNALDHRTAVRVCRCIERRIIAEINAVPSSLPDGEFNRILNGLGARADEWERREAKHRQAVQEWALTEIEHTQTAQRVS